MSGYGFSGDKNLEQTFACTIILHVEAIKQKSWRGIFDSKFH